MPLQLRPSQGPDWSTRLFSLPEASARLLRAELFWKALTKHVRRTSSLNGNLPIRGAEYHDIGRSGQQRARGPQKEDFSLADEMLFQEQ